MIHVGIGYDVHQLVAGRKLILGGVEIPHTRGLDGHSDADALMHAICDALLGALGEEDIGHYFPNTDPRWKFGLDFDFPWCVEWDLKFSRQINNLMSCL